MNKPVEHKRIPKETAYIDTCFMTKERVQEKKMGFSINSTRLIVYSHTHKKNPYKNE